ncbi:MAG: hypothetical protein JST21_04825 [Bacteroidetes bacterium]|nr:hypothetical protein [Bacteroidota bacterium]
MIKFNEIKLGDFLLGDYGDKKWEGEVVRLNNDEKQVCLATEVQELWFETNDLYPLTLDDAAMKKLSFVREDMPDGSVKYKKGAFRMLIQKPDDFSHIDIWYRDDKRINPSIQYVHHLQNHYLQMTKVHLTREPIA